ncbi:MAG: caspase family protein [Nitrospirae bacterium]|nr:caspase family protein [Nitrospirota bacterium]
MAYKSRLHIFIAILLLSCAQSLSFAQSVVTSKVSEKILARGELDNIYFNVEVIKEKPNMNVDIAVLERLKKELHDELIYAGASSNSSSFKNGGPILNISLVCSKISTNNDRWSYISYCDCRYSFSTSDIEKGNYLSISEYSKDPEDSKTKAIRRILKELLQSRDFQQVKNTVMDDVLKTNFIGKRASSQEISLSDIDTNIPVTRNENKNAIAVIIGNSNYQKTKKVDYSINDAQTIKKYLINVFGYKEDNIFYIENASKTDFEVLFGNKDSYQGKLYNAVKEGKSDVFVYYSGHGAPGLKDKKGYFVPVEADPQYLELSGYPADVFYQNLSHIPSRSTTVVLDACFSGTTIFDNISPIAITIDNPVINLKNGVVLSSSSGNQVSTWYNDKNHGMFTYFFLKAIKDKVADKNRDNNLTFEEIYQYITDKTEGVPFYARRVHGVEQNPTIEGNYQGKVLVSY